MYGKACCGIQGAREHKGCEGALYTREQGEGKTVKYVYLSELLVAVNLGVKFETVSQNLSWKMTISQL